MFPLRIAFCASPFRSRPVRSSHSAASPFRSLCFPVSSSGGPFPGLGHLTFAAARDRLQGHEFRAQGLVAAHDAPGIRPPRPTASRPGGVRGPTPLLSARR